MTPKPRHFSFKRTLSCAAVVVLSLTGAGCAMVSGTHEPLAQVAATNLQLPAASAQARAAWPHNGWWRTYQDPQLNELIEQALAGSPSLQVLGTRVESAKVSADGVQKLGLPTGGIRIAPTGQTYSENYIYPPSLAGQWKDSGLIAMSLSWDLDLWGRRRAQYQAAMGQTAAVEFEYEAARQGVAANIVGLHAQLAALNVRRQLLDEQIKLQTATKQRWVEREKAGLQPVLTSVQIDNVLAQLEQLRSTFVAQNDIMRTQLAALVGTTAAQLPSIVTPNRWTALNLPNELPAQILSQRADIAAAQHYIAAASANIKSVKAEFYPNINLNVSAGFQAIGLDKIFKAGSRFDSIDPAITLPIFSGAGLNAKLRGQQAALDTAVAQYNQTVYQAVADAGEQLARYRNTNAQIPQQERLVKNAVQLSGIAQSRYAQGITPVMEVLGTQVNEVSNRDALVVAHAARRAQEAKLTVSLGTGFDDMWRKTTPANPVSP